MERTHHDPCPTRPTPRRYTLHIDFLAPDDKTAIFQAEAYALALNQLRPEVECHTALVSPPGGPARQPVRPLTGASKSINRALETKNRALAGIKGYVTNLPEPDPEQVIAAYSRLLQVEKSFRMSKTDLAARPIYHHTRESIEAPDHRVRRPGRVPLDREHHRWSIKRFVTTTRRYRTIQVQTGPHAITAADPIPDDLRTALDAIHGTH